MRLKKKKQVNKQNPVGNFFERVTQRIIGGELVRNGDGDIILEEERTTIEVKSSYLQSSYGFRLSTEQIDRYAKLSGFPYDRAWYVFYAYDNPSVKDGLLGKRSNKMSKFESVIEIERYCAEHVRWCLLVDLSIIRSWEKALPHSTKSVRGHLGMETVDLHARRVVYPFANGGLSAGLNALQLDMSDFAVLTGRVNTTVALSLYDEYPINIPEVRVVVRREDLPVVRRVLRKQGFRLRQYRVGQEPVDTFSRTPLQAN